MTDVELARAFERGDISNEAFHHLEHLRLAWVCLHECGSPERAAEAMAERVFPVLLEKALPAMFYSPERLHSVEARIGWLAPDLRPVSVDATDLDSRDSPGHPSHRPVPR